MNIEVRIDDYPSFHRPFMVRIKINYKNKVKHIGFLPIGNFKSMNKKKEKKLIGRQISILINAYLEGKNTREINEVYNKYRSKVRLSLI